jgi:hypothetical protein
VDPKDEQHRETSQNIELKDATITR